MRKLRGFFFYLYHGGVALLRAWFDSTPFLGFVGFKFLDGLDVFETTMGIGSNGDLATSYYVERRALGYGLRYRLEANLRWNDMFGFLWSTSMTNVAAVMFLFGLVTYWGYLVDVSGGGIIATIGVEYRFKLWFATGWVDGPNDDATREAVDYISSMPFALGFDEFYRGYERFRGLRVGFMVPQRVLSHRLSCGAANRVCYRRVFLFFSVCSWITLVFSYFLLFSLIFWYIVLGVLG